MRDLAPIILFVYDRPAHTRATIEALKNNELASESEIYIFSDGPRDNSLMKVNEVREILRTVQGFKSVIIEERKINLGLAESIRQGVTQILNSFGRAIILEDDLITASNFLVYMNEALEKYKDQEKVMQISGYNFGGNSNLQEAFFLPLTVSWGWATWKRAWDKFNPDKILFEKIKKDAKSAERFNLYGNYNYLGLWEAVIEGRLKSWAIWWYACVFDNDGFVLYPPKSLVLNKGFDGSGINCDFDQKILDLNFSTTGLIKLPDEVEITDEFKSIFHSIKRLFTPSFFKKIKNKLNKLKERL